jgi:hypothetical protein
MNQWETRILPENQQETRRAEKKYGTYLSDKFYVS